MLPGLVLLTLVLLAGTLERTRLPGALLLIVASVVWLRLNVPMEGALLWHLNDRHGLTAADLAGLGGGALGLAYAVRWRPRRGRGPAAAEVGYRGE